MKRRFTRVGHIRRQMCRVMCPLRSAVDRGRFGGLPVGPGRPTLPDSARSHRFQDHMQRGTHDESSRSASASTTSSAAASSQRDPVPDRRRTAGRAHHHRTRGQPGVGRPGIRGLATSGAARLPRRGPVACSAARHGDSHVPERAANVTPAVGVVRIRRGLSGHRGRRVWTRRLGPQARAIFLNRVGCSGRSCIQRAAPCPDSRLGAGQHRSSVST